MPLSYGFLRQNYGHVDKLMDNKVIPVIPGIDNFQLYL